MDLKFGEIVAIVVALAVPIAAFAVLLIPGAWNAIYGFALNPGTRPYVFYGGAGVVFVILAYRIYRRIGPRPRKPKS